MTALQRQPRLVVVAMTAGLFAAVASLQTANLWWRHDQTLRAAEARAENLARLLGESVRGTFAVADTSLRQLVVHGQRVGGTAAPADAWAPILAAALETIPGQGAISVADATGTIRHSTRPDIVGESRREQFIFSYLSTTPDDELIVDAPFLSLTPDRRYILPVGRRLERRDGTFDGVVVSTVHPAVFRDLFRTLDVGRGGFTWAFHPEAVLILQEPSDTDAIGTTARGHAILEAARNGPESGIVTGPLTSGGRPFISAYRTLSTPPLIVAVSLDRDEVLADWSTQTRNAVATFAALATILAGIVLLLVRQIGARAAVERELREVQRLEAERIRDSHERLEAALAREQRARQTAEDAARAKDEFLMTLSHELRTPLTAIYGWVRMLATGALPAGRQGEAVAAIERNARAQTRLIEDLLDVSAAISGKLHLDARPCELGEVARAAVETLQPALRARRIRLETKFDRTIEPVTADASRVQQIVWNLLSNAIKFTPEGGTVRLSVARAGTHVEIAVQDSGIGIAPELVPYVFERFRQGEAGTRRRYGGLGLGLSIARHLTELHGGTIQVDSEGEGRGATFRVRLPVHPDGAQPRSAVVPARQTFVPAAHLTGIHVLVVDDDADARELFAMVLRGAGAMVQAADSAAAALRALDERTPHVLVSDIEMPGTDGYDLVRQVRARTGEDGVRVAAVAVTAHARSSDERRALEAGYNAHIAKPVDPDRLVAVVASALATHA
jgi:signal transduction histidine kinase/CheY-like chemotaxis protein